MRDRGRVRQGGVGAAQRVRDARHLHRVAAHVHLVEHHRRARDLRARLLQRRQRRHHARLQCAERVVATVERARAVRVALHIAMVHIVPVMAPDDLARPGIQQQLVRVVAMAFLGPIESMRAIAIDQPGAQIRQQAVPDAVLVRMQLITAQLARALAIEHAEFHPGGVLAPQREMHAALDQLRPEGGGTAGQQARGQGGAHAGSNTNVASGGKVSVSECARPWLAMASASSTRPPLPTSLPP